jgi:hypothetical protein
MKSQEKKQTDIANVSGGCVVTIRNTTKAIKKTLTTT